MLRVFHPMPLLTLLLASGALGLAAAPVEPTPPAPEAPMTVTVDAIGKGGWIDKSNAACIATKDGKSTRGRDLRPTIKWTAGPEGTKSYVIVVSDPDVPADLSIANQDELLIDSEMQRQVFYHWVQYNIGGNELVLPGGDKPPGFGYSAANDVSKGTDKFGYGGPCPPWNDARIHQYHFAVYALDVRRLTLPQGTTARSALEALEPHVLAKGEAIGQFTLNPDLRKGQKL